MNHLLIVSYVLLGCQGAGRSKDRLAFLWWYNGATFHIDNTGIGHGKRIGMKNNFPEFDLSAYWQEPDFLLTDLVSLLANRLESDMGITLMIKGAILTGTLVSEREYLATLNNLFKTMARGSSNKPTREQLRVIDEAFGFDDLTEDSYPDRPEEDDDGDEGEDDAAFGGSPIRHLHLKDPVIIYPGSTLSFTESLLPILRVRLITIDGWMLGRITVMRDDDIPDIGLIQ